jgi:small-conductance mechanosensitive channel
VERVLWAGVAALGGALIALGVVQVAHRMMVRLGRRSSVLAELAHRAHRPLQVAATLIAVRGALSAGTDDFAGRTRLLHALLILAIAALGWLVAALLLVAEEVALARVRTDVPDNRQARRVHTQVVMLRRLTVAVVVVLTAGVMLLTFPHVRAIGASVLASAGVIGVVAALAAQSLLGNVFAGLQLAFSDAIRLDDVVVVEGEWGKVEEITLSHVVVRVWDDRRLILPTSRFTTQPYQNWTRTEAAVLGGVELDVDWSVPVAEMRDELRRLLEGTGMWDGRVCVLQVIDATGGMVRVRALVSATDAPTLWDLRCLVREHFVAWVRANRPTALPRMRAEIADGAMHRNSPRSRRFRVPAGPHEEPTDDARVFGGSHDGEARAQEFLGPEEPATAAR